MPDIPLSVRQEAWKFGMSLDEYHAALEAACEPRMALALRSHAEHATSWPSGWIRWTNPIPWTVQMLIDRGWLTEGTPEEGTTSVHITEEGRAALGQPRSSADAEARREA